MKRREVVLALLTCATPPILKAQNYCWNFAGIGFAQSCIGVLGSATGYPIDGVKNVGETPEYRDPSDAARGPLGCHEPQLTPAHRRLMVEFRCGSKRGA